MVRHDALDLGSDSLLLPKADTYAALPVFEYKDKSLGPTMPKLARKLPCRLCLIAVRALK